MLSAVSRRCRDTVDDNDIWLPHIQELEKEYGMRLLRTSSLHSLYCDIKNRQRLYDRRSSLPPAPTESAAPATFSRVSNTPQQRALNLLSIAPAAPRHPGKENSAPFRPRPANQQQEFQLTCPGCSGAAEYPLKHNQFAACGTCWHTFCTICLQAPQDHTQPAPCNPHQFVNPPESLSVLRVLQPHQPQPTAGRGVTQDTSAAASPGKRKAVPEPQVTSPNKRKVNSRQQAVQRLRRL
jgi:hypothetical protein